MKINTFILFLGIWIGVGLIFWFWEGHSLKYDVYSEMGARKPHKIANNKAAKLNKVSARIIEKVGKFSK